MLKDGGKSTATHLWQTLSKRGRSHSQETREGNERLWRRSRSETSVEAGCIKGTGAARAGIAESATSSRGVVRMMSDEVQAKEGKRTGQRSMREGREGMMYARRGKRSSRARLEVNGRRLADT